MQQINEKVEEFGELETIFCQVPKNSQKVITETDNEFLFHQSERNIICFQSCST